MKRELRLTMGLIVSTILIVLTSGCGNVEGQYQSTTTLRTWTVPSDNSGYIAQYDFRYTDDSTRPWDSWTQVLGEPQPSVIGQTQSWNMPLPEGSWIVGMKSADASGNWSDVSNLVTVVIDTTRPVTVTDLD